MSKQRYILDISSCQEEKCVVARMQFPNGKVKDVGTLCFALAEIPEVFQLWQDFLVEGMAWKIAKEGGEIVSKLRVNPAERN